MIGTVQGVSCREHLKENHSHLHRIPQSAFSHPKFALNGKTDMPTYLLQRIDEAL